jgi:membrane protease YdiL (CAAX protease family)
MSDLEDRLNGWIDGILPFEWKGPRNWFGAGRNIINLGSLDADEFMISSLMFFVFFLILTISQQAALLSLTGMTYAVLILWGLLAWSNARRGEASYMGFGRNMRRCAALGVRLALIWVVVCLVAGALTKQTMVSPVQAIAPLRSEDLLMSAAVAFLTIIVISYVESTALAGGLLPMFSSRLGILPAVALIALLGGLLHYVVLNYSAFTVELTILRGLIVYPFALREKSKTVEVAAHTTGNLVSFLLNIIKFTG